MAKRSAVKVLERVMQKRFPYWEITQDHWGSYLKVSDVEAGFETLYHGKTFGHVNAFILGAMIAQDRTNKKEQASHG